MDKPKIVDTMPDMRDLKPGTYFWCACGLSKNQPFCDGAHKPTKFQPVKFEIKTEQRVRICQCKHTKGPPFCDGSHGML